MGQGYYDYLSGAISQRTFWKRHPKPTNPPYDRTADKIQYRSGWEPDAEYLLFDALGWANHGHMDLGTLVQYCEGGRLWIVDGGSENTAARHHSTLDVSRDGEPAWRKFKGEAGRWGDFRDGPQMMEVLNQRPTSPGTPGTFEFTCRARNVAGATWVRRVSGGGGDQLVVQDTLTAEKPGRYELHFRLRLLGAVSGTGGQWKVDQKDRKLAVLLDAHGGDETSLAPWEPDSHTQDEGRYPWYPFVDDDGRPKTIDWHREVTLESGQKTTLTARLGPSQER